MKTYKLQNSRTEDFLHTTRLLFERLLDRGYKQDHLKVVFMESMKKLSFEKVKVNENKKPISNDDRNLFFHLPFNPGDISRSKIQMIYEEECETQYESANTFKNFKNRITGNTMQIEQMTVAYHRAKNIRDVLVPSKLAEVEGKEVARILGCNFITLE